MTTTIVCDLGASAPEATTPLLNDVVLGTVDFKGHPAVRSRTGVWRSTSFIIFAGVAERFAYYAISFNLVSYLTHQMGQSTASAAANLNAWFGISSVLPIVGGFIADSFCGKFRMIVIASVPYMTGLCFMALSTTFTSPDTFPGKYRITVFYASFYLVAIAQAGILPCIEAFGADQFDNEVERESKAKSSFFNWWYFLFTAGVLFPLVLISYIQEKVSWFLGFGIPAIVLFIALVVFYLGTPTYRFRQTDQQRRNPLKRIGRVFFRAARRWRAPEVVSIKEGQSCRFRFLDKALSANENVLSEENLCSVSDVEDAKRILDLVPIWSASIGYSIIYAQPSTLFTKQAATLDLHLTPTIDIPAASLQQYWLTAVAMVVVLLYDRVLVPVARSITMNPSGISIHRRIGLGLFLSWISIICAAIVEQKRLRIAHEYAVGGTHPAYVPMSVWWLAPQYIISAIADVFAMVGLQELFYNQVADDLKSIGFSMYLSILGIGSLLSSLMVSVIQEATSAGGRDGWFADDLSRAHLDYFYWLLAAISGAGLAIFIIFTRRSSTGA